MRDFFRSPLFRCLVCLILVCCVLVNCSPIRAEAVVGELTASALIYLLYAAAAGAVIIPSTIAVANAIGKKVDEEIQVRVAPELVDAWNDITQRYDNWVPEWDPGEWHEDLKNALAGGLLAAISAMMISLVVKGSIEAIGDTAEDGYQYYNGILLPDFSKNVDTSYPNYDYRVILYNSNNQQYTLYVAPSIGTVSYSSGAGYNLFKPGSSISYYAYSSSAQWNGGTFVGASISYGITDPVSIVWSSHDLYFDNGSLFFPGSEPSDTQTITIEPDIYVGDLPDEIRNGEKDEENLNLPLIDPFHIITDPSTAFDDVTRTLQELKDGTITYDEYIERVTDDEPVVDPSGPSDPTDPTEDPEAIPEDMAPYIFDLREIFPFCIPFDLYDFLTCLNASPVAPVIYWEIQLPGGGSYPLDLDLSPFDSVAQLLRRLQLLAFCIALGIKTRDLIKG